LNDIGTFIAQISIWALPTIFAIVCHELMHGFVARGFGDDTAQRAGRLTFNPLAHIDPFGTIVLPALLIFFHLPVFGYAKPVPVSFNRLRPPRLGMLLVAAAGPITNLVLAAASSIAMRKLSAYTGGPAGSSIVVPLIYMAQASVLINVFLAVFNLLPLLPLDGGRVLASLLPRELARGFARLEPYGFLILMFLLYAQVINPIINPIVSAVTRVLL
jgi:Zn-dependent protease